MVKAMEVILRAGTAADKLSETYRWRRLSGTEYKMQIVLLDVRHAGLKARNMLDMMEENDE